MSATHTSHRLTYFSKLSKIQTMCPINGNTASSKPNPTEKTVAGSSYTASDSETLDSSTSRYRVTTRAAERYGDNKLAFFSSKCVLD